MTSEDLSNLLARVEAATGPDRELDREVAFALGWSERKVTKLGLNGRTPGSYRWFSPDYTWNAKGSVRPPAFTGPRKRANTAALLRALQTQEPSNG